MKIKKIIVIIVLSIIEIFLLSIPFHNRVLKPFEGYNKEILINTNNELSDKNYNFYKNFIDYNYYEENYKTNFFYRNGKDQFIFYSYFNYYTEKSYSYIIYSSNDYEDLKNTLLAKYEFAEIPFNYGQDVEFINTIEINDYVFKEIVYDYGDGVDYFYPQYPRKTSYWFSYNDSKKEIAFSIIQNYSDFDLYTSIDTIKIDLKESLYI